MNEKNQIFRGDIFFADLNPVIGSEQGGVRPVVIVQNNTGNQYSPTTQIVPLSTNTDKKATLPTHYKLPAVCGLNEPSIALAEQITTIDKSRLKAYIGHLDYFYMYGIDCTICISFGKRGLIKYLSSPAFQEPMEICLCPVCASEYYDDPTCRIHRKDYSQVEKDECSKCNRTGYDFIVKRFAKRAKEDEV